jgi:hypothetical protein
MTGWIVGSIAGAGSVGGLIIAIVLLWKMSKTKDAYAERYVTAAAAATVAEAANQTNLSLIKTLQDERDKEREANVQLQDALADLAARGGAGLDGNQLLTDLRALSSGDAIRSGR